MTALTANRDTPRLGDDATPSMRMVPVDANVHCFQGGLAAVAAGFARPARATVTDFIAGVFAEECDNSGGGAQGAKKTRIRRGTYYFASGGGADAIAQANVGQLCYASDDATVNLTNGSGARPVVGVIEEIDASFGIAVSVGLMPAPAPAIGDSTAAPGNATLNTLKGRGAIAAGQTAAVITDNMVSAASVISVTPEDIDANVTKFKVAPGAGSFTVTVNAATAATWKFNYSVQS